MKSYRHHHFLQTMSRWSIEVGTAVVLGLATPTAQAATSATSYTSTGYLIEVPYAGDTLALAADNVHVWNMLTRLRIQSTDARLTRRATVPTHGYYHPDGSATIYGTWIGEVGTWDMTDPQDPKFSIPVLGRRRVRRPRSVVASLGIGL